MFEYYVLNYDRNKKRIVNYNIFNNMIVNDRAEKLVEEYVSSSKKSAESFNNFCNELKRIISWEEHFRCEYEILVGDVFSNDLGSMEKWDCYMQCEQNIKSIAYTILAQYADIKYKGSPFE